MKHLIKSDQIKLIRNDCNKGFIHSCNSGASLATGEYLIFLNNDTEVLNAWLDSLIAPFIIHDNVGLVGSQIIYPDGRLQEAGGVILSDGSGLNYGRLSDPNKPEYNFLREVDYCSGCSIAIKKSLFDSIGGFDTLFIPAYYEDTDIAFTVRKMGYKVLYQPASKVIHHEGITSGTDLKKGVKKFQNTNKIKFYNKWETQLKSHNILPDNYSLAKCKYYKDTILFIDACTPTPDKDSGSVDAFFHQYIFTKLNFKVTFIPDNLIFLDGYTQVLQQLGIECLYKPHITSIENFLKTRGAEFKYVVLSRVGIAVKHINAIKKYCPNSILIFNLVDIHYIREARQARTLNSIELLHKAKKTKATELSIMKRSDVNIIISESEVKHLSKIDPELKLFNLPLILDMHQRTNNFENRKNIMFIGGFQHSPNVDAVLYFSREIWPLVKTRLVDAHFIIIGSEMPNEIINLHNQNGILSIGYIEDLSPFFNSCKFSIAPLRYGAGQKGKLARSGSYGLPSVATSIAVEGMGLKHEKHILIADKPDDFANSIERLYHDSILWEKLSKNIYDYTNSEYSITKGISRISNLIHALN